MRVFDTKTGAKLQEFSTPNAIGGLSLSPNEDRVVIGNSDGSAKVYDTSTGAEVLSYDDQGFMLASYSPDFPGKVTSILSAPSITWLLVAM